mgnify:CR=1 FL=1
MAHIYLKLVHLEIIMNLNAKLLDQDHKQEELILRVGFNYLRKVHNNS